MRAAFLSVLLIASGASAANITFATPGQVAGEMTAAAEWAVIVIPPGFGGSFLLDLANGGQYTSHTAIKVQRRGDLGAEGSSVTPLPDPDPEQVAPNVITGLLEPTGWKSIIVMASQLDVGFRGNTSWDLANANQSFEGLIGDSVPTGSIRHTWQVPAAATRLQGNGAGVTIHGSATQFEWHNATVSCTSTCPSNGGTLDALEVSTSGANAWNLAHHELRTNNGVISIEVEDAFLLIGAQQIIVNAKGQARLPAAQLDSCSDCIPPDGTLRLAGAMNFDGMRQVDGKVAGPFSGDLTSVLADEAHVEPAKLLGYVDATAVVVAGLALSLGLLKAVSVLAVRLAQPTALEHPRRILLYNIIEANPGIRYRSMLAQARIANGPAYHHLTVLQRAGLVYAARVGLELRLYPSKPTHDDLAKPAPGGKASTLLEYVRAHPGCSQTALAAALSIKRPTLHYRLSKLVSAGQVRIEGRGRLRVCFPVPNGDAPRGAQLTDLHHTSVEYS